MTVIMMVGRAITDGSIYLPIRHLAGRIAATAPPKNYYAQIQAIYDAITRDLWRYTFDPVGQEMIVTAPEQMFTITLGGGHNSHRGYGDCDDITAAGGALLRSIGMQTAIGTCSLPMSPNIFDHIFLFARPPRSAQWICFDPVMYPDHGYGDISPYERLAVWSLDGRLLKKIGPFPPRFDAVMRRYGNCRAVGAIKNLSGTEIKKMTTPSYFDFADYSDQVNGFGATLPSLDHRYIPDFQQHGIAGFGCYAETMGYVTGEQMPHILTEVDASDYVDNTGLVRTKHFEMDPADYAHMIKYGAPQIGSLTMSDEGDIYSWQQNPDGVGSIFRKIARRVKRRVKKIGKGVKKFAKKIGKTKVFRLGKKILKTAMKYVKPFLKKYGGQIMQAVAPIAAVIPGVGPVLSTALVVGGRAYQMAQQMGVKFDAGKNPIFQSVKQAADFKNVLMRAAKKLGKKGAKDILRKFEKKAGISGGSDEIGIISDGVNFRTVAYSGYGWA